jgi:hypothetical protein
MASHLLTRVAGIGIINSWVAVERGVARGSRVATPLQYRQKISFSYLFISINSEELLNYKNFSIV